MKESIGLCRIGGRQTLELADEVEQLWSWHRLECPTDCIHSGDTRWEFSARGEWRQSRCGRRWTGVHEVGRWQWHPVALSLLILVLILVLIARAAVVIAIVDAQGATLDFVIVQVANGRRGRVGVAVLQEAEALGLTRLLVIDQAESDDLPSTPEYVHDLLLADSIWDVADEDDAAALFALRHDGRDRR